MARKKISAAARGRVLIHQGEKSKRHKSTMQIWKDDIQASPEVISLAWAAAARHALKIEDMTFAFFPDANGKLVRHEMPADFFDQSAHAMRHAFDHFKLDPADPWAWRQMVSYFAFVFFWPEQPRRRGRKTEWTSAREAELEKAIQTLPGLSDLRAAQKLANDKLSPFYVSGVEANAGVEGLRKKIGAVKRKSAPRKVGTK
jgi:hypothetical protein